MLFGYNYFKFPGKENFPRIKKSRDREDGQSSGSLSALDIAGGRIPLAGGGWRSSRGNSPKKSFVPRIPGRIDFLQERFSRSNRRALRRVPGYPEEIRSTGLILSAMPDIASRDSWRGIFPTPRRKLRWGGALFPPFWLERWINRNAAGDSGLTLSLRSD